MSRKFLKCSDEDLLKKELKINSYNSYKTIGERYDYACEELKINAGKLKKNFPNTNIVGFVMYRIGLHRVIFKRFDNM